MRITIVRAVDRLPVLLPVCHCVSDITVPHSNSLFKATIYIKHSPWHFYPFACVIHKSLLTPPPPTHTGKGHQPSHPSQSRLTLRDWCCYSGPYLFSFWVSISFAKTQSWYINFKVKNKWFFLLEMMILKHLLQWHLRDRMYQPNRSS